MASTLVASSSTPVVSSTTIMSIPEATSSTSSTAPTPSTLAPASDCDVQKYPPGIESSFYSNTDTGGLDGCTALCVSQDRCTFFILSSGSYCFLYDIAYDPTGALLLDYIILYQRSCFPGVQSSDTASSSVPSLSSSVQFSSSTEAISSTSVVLTPSPVLSTSTSDPTPSPTFTPVGDCGVHKYLRGINKYDYFDFLTKAGVKQCAAFCLSRTRCTFFTVSAQNPPCLLYDLSYTHTQTDSSEVTTLYQRSCFPPQ